MDKGVQQFQAKGRITVSIQKFFDLTDFECVYVFLLIFREEGENQTPQAERGKRK